MILGAVEQGDEADEARSTSVPRSLSPVFDGPFGGVVRAGLPGVDAAHDGEADEARCNAPNLEGFSVRRSSRL